MGNKTCDAKSTPAFNKSDVLGTKEDEDAEEAEEFGNAAEEEDVEQ